MTVTPESRHPTASMVVLDPATGRVLLVHQRASDLWLFPGGHVDEGETPSEAAVREVFEETGVKATIVGDPAVAWRVEDFPAPAKPERPGRPAEPAHTHTDHLFAGTADSRAVITAAVSEVASVAWVPVSGIHALDVRVEVPGRARAALKHLTAQSPTA